MSNSPPSAKSGSGSSSTSSTKRRSSTGSGGGTKSNKTPKNTTNALSAFGFTSKKKRPAADTTTTSASDAAVVDLSMTASSSPSSDIEIVTSPSKRAKVDEQERRSTTATLTSTASKIGKGKENGTTKKEPSSSTAAVMGFSGSSSATPATNGKLKSTSSSAVKSASKSSGGSQRSALLDLTQDSSSDSMDVKLPDNNTSTAAAAITSTSAAAAGGGGTKQSKTLSLANLAGGLAGKLLATTSTHQKNQQQKQQQRRGKRDRQHPSTKQQQQQKSAVQSKTTQVGGASTTKPSTSDEPISIFEDEPFTTNTAATTNTNKKSKTTAAKPPQFTVDQIVNVQDRTWPGRNDQGGVAKIIKVHFPQEDGTTEETKYDVKYILESRKEKNVEERYITEHSDYASPDKNKNRKASRKTQEKGLPGLLLNGGKKKQQGPTPGKRAVGNKISDELERIENSRGSNREGDGAKSGAVKSNGAPKTNTTSNKKMEESPNQRKGSIEAYLSPSKKDAAANSPNRQDKKKARIKSPKKSPSRQASTNFRANALGLVRVPNPHQIACTSAVAKYKDLPYDPETSDVKRIFPNAILGRSSSKTKSNFVDLGISNKAPGISRNNIKVVEVRGLTDGDSTTTTVAPASPVREESQQSQASTASIASSTTRHQPTMTIQVYEKCNGVEVYKTRRGERSNGAYLPAGKQSTLRIGDAIEFISDERMAYCLVGLMYSTDTNKVKGKEADAARLLDFTPKEKMKASKKVDEEDMSGDKKNERSAETDKTMEVEVLDKPKPKEGKTSQKSGTQDTKTDESMDVTMDLDDSQRSEVKTEETTLQKGDDVKVFFVVDKDMFGESTREWYFGTVKKVESIPDNTSKCNVVVNFEDGSSDTYEYPGEDIEKLSSAKDSVEFFPEVFIVGDLVDGLYQDGGSKGRWFRGRVASISEDGNKTCDILYYDGDYESNIPTKQKKVRLITRCDSTNEDWLVGKSAMISNDLSRIGIVSKESSSNNYKVTFLDGSSESANYQETARAVLANLRKDLPLNRQHIWPVSTSASMADTIRLRRQRKEQKKNTDEYGRPLPVIKTEPGTETQTRTRSSRSRSNSMNSMTSVKSEPAEDDIVFDAIDSTGLDEDFSELCIPDEGGPAIDPSILENRKEAKDFPPGLPNMLWCALNSAEAQTGSNFLRDMLSAHDSVPPSSMVNKLMDLMKFGPKAEGSSVHFKDPYRTELAAQYVYGLLWASRRLVRRDTGALFGPSSWDDIEVLLEQSIKQTENMIFGRRLAQGLHLAARGSKLLSMMLLTELQGYDLYSTATSTTLDTTTMPSVRLVKSYGVRGALKLAVQQMTKCLVRHSRWVMDSGGIELSTTKSTSDESCCLEARECLDNLGSVVCAIAWLFCNEERVGIDDSSVAFVIKDSFLVEVERSLEDCPDLKQRAKNKFLKKCKMYFLMSLKEGFADQMVVTVGEMIGCAADLKLVGLA